MEISIIKNPEKMVYSQLFCKWPFFQWLSIFQRKF